MLYAPRMLLTGSAGRNSGKTVFACDVLRRFASEEDIVAAKVTTIQERGGACPRGGDGCGVCSSLETDYCITEETAKDGPKDTQRLLAAGAKRVYWLRVLKEHLEQGARALLETIGDDHLTICESNSLRAVVEPGLFLLFRRRQSNEFKASAKAVRRWADRVVVFDGNRFDVDPGAICLVDGHWMMRHV